MLSMFRQLRGPQPRTQASYERLVVQVADGKPLPDDLDDILAGRAPEHFEEDVRTLLDRRAAAATLANSADLQAEAVAAEKAVAAAKAALANDEFAQLLAQHESRKRALHEAQTAMLAASGAVSGPKAHAQALLMRTAARSIDSELASVSGEQLELSRQREKLQLTGDEAKRRAECEADVATLPARIAHADKTESAGMMARLTSAKATLRQFAERLKEAERIGNEIEKLSRVRGKIEARRHVPENMNFASQPKVSTY